MKKHELQRIIDKSVKNALTESNVLNEFEKTKDRKLLDKVYKSLKMIKDFNDLGYDEQGRISVATANMIFDAWNE